MNIPTKLTPDAKLPKKAHDSDAGFDLFALDSVDIGRGVRGLIDTGVSMAIPDGYCGIIKEKSGLAWKHGIIIMGGVIDSSYRGNIKVIMLNANQDTFSVKGGDKIAQLLILPVPNFNVEEVDSLDDTIRGSGGFGSTGI